jgi:hypothetical protein
MSKKEAFLQFLKAARSLQDRGLSKEAILQFAKNEFGELSELFKKQIDNLFKPKKGIENIKIKDEVFDDTVINLPIDDTGQPFNPNNPLKEYGKPKKSKKMTDVEEAIDNASPGFADDRKYDAQLVADDLAEKRFGKEFYDLDEIDQMELYDEAYQGLSKQRFKQQQNLEKQFNKDVEEAGGMEAFLNANPISEKPTFRLNKERFKKDFNVTDEEVEKISLLSPEDQQKKVKEYIDKDFKERIELSDYDVTDLEPNAEGGRAGYAEAGSVRKDPDEVVAGMDNELNPGFFDQLPFFGAGKYPLDKDQGVSLIEEIQDYKYGESYPNEKIGVKEKGIFNVIPKPDRPPMSVEETIKALEDRWDMAIEEGYEPGKGGEFDDLGIYSKEDIRRRVELGYDQAKGPKIKTGIMTAAAGGRAGYYGGGQAMIEPDLSDIGHGSDALMARTRITAPGSQATTSTGLNYLLGEDNDNVRVPFNEGLLVPPAKPYTEDMFEKDSMILLKGMYGTGPESNTFLYNEMIKKGNKLRELGVERETVIKIIKKNKNKITEFLEAQDTSPKSLAGLANGGRINFQSGLNFDKAFEKMLEKETEVEKNPNEIIEEKITEKLTPFIPNETEKEKEEKEMFKMVEEYQKFKKDNPDSRMSLFMFRDKKKKEKTLLKNKIIELDLKYPEKEIIDKETNMVNKENLKSAIDEAEANLEISPIDGLTLKRTINTEGEQSTTSGSFDLGNLNFSSDNIEEGKLTSKGNFTFGGVDLSGMVNSNDGQILNTELGFNYNNALKGKLNESDGYRSTELDLNKTFPISDKFNLNLTGSADTQTFNGKTYKSSDLTPKLSYNDGILSADISKEILEGGDGLNLGAGVNYNNFYAKGDDLLSKDRSGVIGYQKEFGDKDGDLFFTAGAEKNIFDDEYTGGVGLKYKFADGGIAGLRQGYSKGKKVGVDLARRGFLKVLGATAAGVAAFKSGVLKVLGKTSTTKSIPKIVEIGKDAGAPPWFEPMVNKVLTDGLDITKKNATMDGQIVKSLDTPTGKVEVNYDTRSGNVDVNYSGENTAMGEGVDMRYVVGQADEGTKGVKPADEFEAVESIPEGRMTGPNDYNVEFRENATGEVKNLFSDVSELQTLGGDKRLINDISVTLQKKKTLKKMNENPDQFASDNLPDYDY